MSVAKAKVSSLFDELQLQKFSFVKCLIYMYFISDCKSAYAGSIPTSASTLENPVD